MKFSLNLLAVASLLATATSAHPGHHHHHARQAEGVSVFSASKFPDVQKVLEGNQRFRDTRDAAAIQNLVDNGQTPPFMMFSCSDSRAPEATVFDSQPGTFFMSRNIANQYKPGDENAQSAMAYGVRVLGVQHVVVLGHYGCGGIAAAIASAPQSNINVATHVVQTWIGDVRNLYFSSNRSEIVEMREKNLAIEAGGGIVEEPDVREPGFRALVEENIKQQVKRISESSVIKNLNEQIVTELNVDGTPKANPEGSAEKRAEEENKLIPVFVHGWVHDIETGEVIDLNISTGPAGFENFVPNVVENQPETQPEGQQENQQQQPEQQETEPSSNQQLNAGSENLDVKEHGVTFTPAKRVFVRRTPRWTRAASKV